MTWPAVTDDSPRGTGGTDIFDEGNFSFDVSVLPGGAPVDDVSFVVNGSKTGTGSFAGEVVFPPNCPFPCTGLLTEKWRS